MVENFPFAQFSQKFAPKIVEYLPGSHAIHVAEPGTGVKVPGAQFSQKVARTTENLPAPQLVQTKEASVEYLPAAQLVQLER